MIDRYGLGVEQLGWGTLCQPAIDWLKANGVTGGTVSRPWPINCAMVRFVGGRFTPAGDGERALTVPAIEDGEIVDIAAWAPRSGRLAPWRGIAFGLGIDDALNPATYWSGGALHVHRSPLSWLQEGRVGLVILRPEMAHVYLAGVPALSFDDQRHAVEVSRHMDPPRRRKPRLFVRRTAAEAA